MGNTNRKTLWGQEIEPFINDAVDSALMYGATLGFMLAVMLIALYPKPEPGAVLFDTILVVGGVSWGVAVGIGLIRMGTAAEKAYHERRA